MSSETGPTLVAPAMRFIPVSDTERSVTFYRDILGFSEQQFRDEYDVGAVAELSYGPARIQFVPQSNDESESVILFFEADDVVAVRDAIVTRGGQASSLQKVNWIKMEMFEVRDPDGHTLWFGKSFQQPNQAQPPPMMHQMLPHFPLNNVPAGVEYYQALLGFKINYAQDDLGVMYRDKGTLLLIQRTTAHTGIGSCTVYIEDADKLYAELIGKGANVEGPPVSRPWGLRDFTVIDLEGNKICFAQPFE